MTLEVKTDTTPDQLTTQIESNPDAWGKGITPVYANKFSVVLGRLVRVAFGESISQEPPRYHTVLMLTHEDAAELRDALVKLLDLPQENPNPERTS